MAPPGRPRTIGKWLASGFAILAVMILFSVTWFTNYLGMRDSIRWVFESKAYKSAILAQPVSGDGELQHLEWNAWGFAGQDTFVFMAFDPTDALSIAAKSKQAGKFPGLPCEVYRVRRLETHWYVVQFYTETYWGQEECAALSAKRK